jgi:elongator complex protein 3
MIKEAERIVKEEYKLNKIAVISGVGARNYYKEKLNYILKDGYMVKLLKD